MFVPSICTSPKSNSDDNSSNIRWKTPFLAQRRKRWNTVFHLPKRGGRSRHAAPVRAIHNTASTKRRLSSPVRPRSPFLPAHNGSIRAHCASLSIFRSARIGILASLHAKIRASLALPVQPFYTHMPIMSTRPSRSATCSAARSPIFSAST